MKLSASVVGTVFCATSDEELGRRKAEEEHRREEGGCGVMWKGKAAAEKWGRIQAGEQLGKMREVVKRVWQSWTISFHVTAAMWRSPYAGVVSVELSAHPGFLRWAGSCATVEYEPNRCRHLTRRNKTLLENRKGEFNVGCRGKKTNQKTQSKRWCSKG